MDIWRRDCSLAQPLGVRTAALKTAVSGAADPFKVSPINNACDAFNAPRGDGGTTGTSASSNATSFDYFSGDDDISPCSSVGSELTPDVRQLMYASSGTYAPLVYGQSTSQFSPIGPFSPSLLICTNTQPYTSSGSPSPQFSEPSIGTYFDPLFVENASEEFAANYFDGYTMTPADNDAFYGVCQHLDDSDYYFPPAKSEVDVSIENPAPYSRSKRKRRKSPHRVPRNTTSKLARLETSDKAMSFYDEILLRDFSTLRKRNGCTSDFELDDGDFYSRSARSSSVSSLSADGGNGKDRETIANDKLLPLMPAKTRSKMHDLAIKHQLITNQNTRGQGLIQLSAEEKQTLIQEGYRLPTRLPLTRDEEEALKIVRRKIKNKLSAQESRRKRKEYNDALEKKVRAFYNDNLQLHNRIKQLNALNRDLVSQLKKFQQPQI